MDAYRALDIANQFAAHQDCDVDVWTKGIVVKHHGQESYFTREECFWPFIFRFADELGLSNVRDIETQLSIS